MTKTAKGYVASNDFVRTRRTIPSPWGEFADALGRLPATGFSEGARGTFDRLFYVSAESVVTGEEWRRSGPPLAGSFRDGQEHKPSVKGRIQKRKTNRLQIIKSSLQRTAGPYNGAISGSGTHSITSSWASTWLPWSFRQPGLPHGWAKTWLGEPKLAIERFARAMRLILRLNWPAFG